MIYRRIFKVKTKSGTLWEPDIQLPIGVNLLVLEYGDDYAIVEVWCSDHPILEERERKTDEDLQELEKHPNVIEKLEKHSKSPKIIGGIYLSENNYLSEVDEKTKTLKFKDKTCKYIEKRRHIIHTNDGKGKEENLYVLDEG